MSNQPNQTNRKLDYKTILAFLAGVLAVYFVVTFVVNQRLNELKFQTQLLISEQEILLASIAEIVARNGADEITERIIRDCSLPERIRFDELLSSLDRGLSQVQLVELERLFGRCGNFFAERKSVMAARLEREIEIYEMFVRQLSNVTKADATADYNVDEWIMLSELESKQSQLFLELVAVQDRIITLLLEGSLASSEEVQATLQEARQIQESLFVANSQASSLRSNLVSL